MIHERKRGKIQSLDNVIMFFCMPSIITFFLFYIWKTVLYFYIVQRWQHMLQQFTMGKTSCGDNDEFTAI
jgi:hypothetical protein